MKNKKSTKSCQSEKSFNNIEFLFQHSKLSDKGIKILYHLNNYNDSKINSHNFDLSRISIQEIKMKLKQNHLLRKHLMFSNKTTENVKIPKPKRKFNYDLKNQFMSKNCITKYNPNSPISKYNNKNEIKNQDFTEEFWKKISNSTLFIQSITKFETERKSKPIFHNDIINSKFMQSERKESNLVASPISSNFFSKIPSSPKFHKVSKVCYKPARFIHRVPQIVHFDTLNWSGSAKLNLSIKGNVI